MYNNKQRRCLTPQLPSEQSSVNSLLPTIFLIPSFLLSSSACPPTTQCFAHEKQQWNGIMWIITFPNKQYSFFPHCHWILLGRFGFSIEENIRARKNSSSHSTCSFLCVIIPFSYFFLTLECLILWHCASTSPLSIFFFIAILCDAMTWSEENYIATYFPEFPTFIRKAKKKKEIWAGRVRKVKMVWGRLCRWVNKRTKRI